MLAIISLRNTVPKQFTYWQHLLTKKAESGTTMPLTPSFKPVTKIDINWENMLSQSFIQRWKSLCFGMHFSKGLKTGSSKTAANYSNSSSFENTFSLLFWPYCFGLKSTAAVSLRLTSLSLVRSITDHEKGEHCDLHSMLYNDP